MHRLAPLLLGVAIKGRLTSIDWVVIALYFGILAAVAWWVIRKGKRFGGGLFLWPAAI